MSSGTLSAKQLATTLHFMQGTPYIYQGEEIGMTNVKFDSIEDYRDGDSIRFYEDMHVDHKRLSHEEAMQAIYIKGRDNARTPGSVGQLGERRLQPRGRDHLD